MSVAISQFVPRIAASSAATSGMLITTGRWVPWRARTVEDNPSTSTPSTSRQRNRREHNAWLCVLAETRTHGQVGQVVANDARVDVRVALLLPLGRVPEDALDPADVGALRSIGVVTGAQPRSEFTQNRQWLDAAGRAGHRAVWQPAPVGSSKEVDEGITKTRLPTGVFP